MGHPLKEKLRVKLMVEFKVILRQRIRKTVKRGEDDVISWQHDASALQSKP